MDVLMCQIFIQSAKSDVMHQVEQSLRAALGNTVSSWCASLVCQSGVPVCLVRCFGSVSVSLCPCHPSQWRCPGTSCVPGSCQSQCPCLASQTCRALPRSLAARPPALPGGLRSRTKMWGWHRQTLPNTDLGQIQRHTTARTKCNFLFGRV